MPRRRKKNRFINATIPAFEPDYPSLIQNDPTYHQFHLGQQAASEGEKGYRNQGLASALINFGSLPADMGDLGDFHLTAEQIKAIQDNTAAGGSVTAGLDRQHNQEVQSLQDYLASTGMLSSGAKGIRLQNEQTAYGNRQRNALTNAEGTGLLDILAKLQREFTDAEGGRATDDATQLGLAEERQRALNPARAARRVKARRVGNNLYMDASGNYYDRNGRPIVSGAKPGRPGHRGSGRPHGGYVPPVGGYGGGGGRYDG